MSRNRKTLGSRRSKRQVAVFYPHNSRRGHDLLRREADAVVAAAIHSGALVRRPCEVCGKEKSEAHHDDYAKPLDVKWLCRFHHRIRDAELREAWRAELRRIERDALPKVVQQRLDRLAQKNKPPVANPEVVVQSFPPRRTYRSRLVLQDCSVELVRQATTVLADALDATGESECFLAKRLGVSRQQVNQMFAGGVRTLKALASIADALGYDASVVLRKRESRAVAS